MYSEVEQRVDAPLSRYKSVRKTFLKEEGEGNHFPESVGGAACSSPLREGGWDWDRSGRAGAGEAVGAALLRREHGLPVPEVRGGSSGIRGRRRGGNSLCSNQVSLDLFLVL